MAKVRLVIKPRRFFIGRELYEALLIWEYEGVIKKALGALKYSFASDVAKEIAMKAALIIKNFDLFKGKKVVLIPVPLSLSRERWRGFNQTEKIGQVLSENLGWELCTFLLKRRGKSTPQVGLDKKEREENVKDAFYLARKEGTFFKNLKNREIIVFDDVLTTGSTIKEALRTFCKAGFKKLSALSIAGSL